MTDAAQELKPNEQAIRAHLQFILSGMDDYKDGRIEVGGLAVSENYGFDAIENSVKNAMAHNRRKKNTYLIGSILDPDTFPSGRAGDKDFYASNVVWCDIDAPHDEKALKELYRLAPPNRAVITARVKTRRVQLWWKLSEPLQDSSTLRDILVGVCQALGGDSKVINPCSLMRLGGTVNYPNDAKKADGRIDEVTEYHVIHDEPVSYEKMMDVYPVRQTASGDIKFTEYVFEKPEGILGKERISDGRDHKANSIVFPAIINLTATLGRWPTAQEVFDDVWPVYSNAVVARTAAGLEHEGRGQTMIAQKIKSKLALFKNGSMKRYGFATLEDVVANGKKRESYSSPRSDVGAFDPKTGEVLEPQKPPTPTTGLKYVKYNEITPCIDADDFVQGLLSNNQLSVVYGESNCGKTFFMTDLAFHIALGKPWREKRTEQGGVIYAALEGSYGLRNRVSAFRNHHKADGDLPFAMVASQIDFLSPQGNIAEFITLVNKAADDLGSVKLVVVDTLARALMGGDENSAQDMGMLVSHADKIRYATGAHVCFIHHSGKDKLRGARGHSSLRAAVDTEIEISREKDTDKFSTVKIVKQREMEKGEDMFFGLQQVELGLNKYKESVNSCVVTVIKPDDIPNKEKQAVLSPAQGFVYDAILNQMIDSGQSRRVHPDMPNVKCITYEEFRSRLEADGTRSYFDKDGTPEKVKSGTQAARIALKKKGKIGFNAHYIWLID